MSPQKVQKKPLKVYIPIELDTALRNSLPFKGGKLSEFVEEAIREKMEREGLL